MSAGIRDDLRKLNQWLSMREDGRVKASKFNTNQRRLEKRRKRMACERVARWRDRHRRRYNAIMRVYMRKRRRVAAGAQSA